ncbi:MAG: protein-L-isoaspartate O-methyltransferase [Parcubacteria group bacterium CG_4_9_14_0_2_um_filter_35_11]|nr:MAG: protein-L-isoaspartate O-methyltransferase [Parcubacteria group bacterium CG07_land_8_20_14_0_80_35_11]PJC47659.1 MAG: protein-L-isoaspartate O-methyltransferase [Parcubacteria group bacterium CG_4_9_14_0_2_um_filter_35_11]
MSLIDSLILRGYLKTPSVIEAFRKIKRADFLPSHLKSLSDIDEALPIGEGQTISQPAVVAFMIELLEPKKGEKILDVGSGSGWTTALLAQIVGEKGKVFGIELIPSLAEFGKENIKRYNFIENGIVKILCQDGSKGLPEEAPFDKILVSASAEDVSQAFREQLKKGGKLVIPISTSIWLFKKKEKDVFEEKEYPGFVFVPLIS